MRLLKSIYNNFSISFYKHMMVVFLYCHLKSLENSFGLRNSRILVVVHFGLDFQNLSFFIPGYVASVVLDCDTATSTFNLMNPVGGSLQTRSSLRLSALASGETCSLNSWTLCSRPRITEVSFGVSFPCSTLYLRF